MEQASPTLTSTAPADATLCPRCEKALVDPSGLGWCQACGYCRSLDEDRTRLALAPAANTAPAGPSVMAAVQVPRWVIVLLAGVVVLAAVSWALGYYLPLNPLHRAIWATVQAAAGLLILFAGQAYALMRIAPEEASLNFTDAVIPFRLYGLVCKRLPRLGHVLCIASWGLTLTVSGLLLIGGMGHWLKYLPKSQESQKRR